MGVKMIIFTKNEEGQSIFEFIMFLPFFIYLLSVMVNVGNAINASINQQKASRSYTFHLYKGNSNAPPAQDLLSPTLESFNSIDLIAIGWREKEVNNISSLAPCFKFQSFLSGESSNETCERPLIENSMTNFIRVYTAFGWCGATYHRGENDLFRRDENRIVGPSIRPCFRKGI